MKNAQTLHVTAFQVLQNLMVSLGITADALVLTEKKGDILWIHTYPEVCKMAGITAQECWDPYGDLGNREIYEEDGRLFTIIVLAINESDDQDEYVNGQYPTYFWVEFVFMDDNTVSLKVGTTNVNSPHCDTLLKEITGFEEKHIFTHNEAAAEIKKLQTKMKENIECFVELA